MGLCSGKFFSTDPNIQTLHRRVRPTDNQVENQQAYWRDLADYLKDDLKSKTGYPTSHWLQGSYKFGTQIRPPRKGDEFDIDLGIYFAWADFPDDGRYSALELKQFIQDSLKAYASDPETDALRVTDPKEFCSRIIFDGDFHIDVPAYHEWDDVRTLASKSDDFVESDPCAIYDWWVNAFETDAERDRARRIVRYLKMWAGLKFDRKTETPPSSILLTVLVGKLYADALTDAPSGDDEVLHAVVSQIVSFFRASNDNSVTNPANEDENLNRLGGDFDGFAEKLKDLEDICARAVAAANAEDGCEIWAEAFEHFFPPADESQIMVLEKAATGQGRFVPEVQIQVTLKSGKTATLRNSAINVPKDSSLRFELLNYNELPNGSLVKWVVRNEGPQAESVNDLGHFSGYGRVPQKETAEYNGRHFMDVTVTRDGAIIGRRRVPVSILATDLRARAKRLFRNKRR